MDDQICFSFLSFRRKDSDCLCFKKEQPKKQHWFQDCLQSKIIFLDKVTVFHLCGSCCLFYVSCSFSTMMLADF